MTASRQIPDLTSDPGGVSGADWTAAAGESIEALWALNGGVLSSMAGTNTLTGTVAVSTGFSAYTDGLRVGFIAPNTNTGAATLNLNSLGAKSLLDPDGDALAAGAYAAGRFTSAIFVAADDAFRLETSGGTTNVTVEGGTFLQRSSPSRLAAAVGPDTALTSVGAVSFQCGQITSRVFIEGNVSRVTSSGSADVDGCVIALFVDGSQVESFTDHCQPSSHASTAFSFEYSPGDITSHSYEIRVSSTISATYPKGGNWLVCSEIAPNA